MKQYISPLCHVYGVMPAGVLVSSDDPSIVSMSIGDAIDGNTTDFDPESRQDKTDGNWDNEW